MAGSSVVSHPEDKDQLLGKFGIGILTFNGVEGPALKYNGARYSVNSVDGSAAGRNQNGDMIRALICNKGKWEFEFAPCTTSQLNAVLKATELASFDLHTPVGSGTYYAGERSAPMLYYDREKHSWLWVGFTLHCIEI